MLNTGVNFALTETVTNLPAVPPAEQLVPAATALPQVQGAAVPDGQYSESALDATPPAVAVPLAIVSDGPLLTMMLPALIVPDTFAPTICARFVARAAPFAELTSALLTTA